MALKTKLPTLGKIRTADLASDPHRYQCGRQRNGTASRILQALKDQVSEGTLCSPQCKHTEIVYGHGHPGAKILFVGDSPGPREDEVGLPFVDEAGLLLGKMIRAMGMKAKRHVPDLLGEVLLPDLGHREPARCLVQRARNGDRYRKASGDHYPRRIGRATPDGA